MISQLPLCVDLDGTLIFDDVSQKAFKILLKEFRFKDLFCVFLGLLKGIAAAKHEIASCIDLNPADLKYNESFLEFLKEEKSRGRKIFLATGANEKYANLVADYLGIFEKVFASSSSKNLIAEQKAKCLSEEFGEFAYAGNSMSDIAVWKRSAECIVVAPFKGVISALKTEKIEYTLFEQK